MNKKITRRIALLFVLVMMLTVITGCSSSKTTSTLSYDDTKFADHTEDGCLSEAELKDIAGVISDAYGEGYDAREGLLASLRGYDITVSKTDTTATEAKTFVSDYALKTLQTAYEEAGETYNYTAKTLTEEDVKLLVSAFSVDVDVNGSTGILQWIGTALKAVTDVLGGSYVVGICVFAILWEIILIYFSIRQQKNSIRQASLRPKEMAIKKRYQGRSDQKSLQKQQEEIQAMYQQENFNPYSGCLPLLLQMPLLIALYYIVINPLQYVLGQASSLATNLLVYVNMPVCAGGMGASVSAVNTRSSIELLSYIGKNWDAFIGGLKDFALFTNGDAVSSVMEGLKDSIPDFTLFGLDLGVSPQEKPWPMMLVPIFVFISYMVSTKLTRKFTYQPAVNEGMDKRQQACSNWTMDISMPLISAFFCYSFPAIIGVYWAFRSWIGLLKSFILSRAMPLPVITEEEIKAAEKELNSRSPKKIEKNENAGVKRSLHHIDDEDFEDTREKALELKEKREQLEQAEKENEKKLPGLKALNQHEEKEKKDENHD